MPAVPPPVAADPLVHEAGPRRSIGPSHSLSVAWRPDTTLPTVSTNPDVAAVGPHCRSRSFDSGVSTIAATAGARAEWDRSIRPRRLGCIGSVILGHPRRSPVTIRTYIARERFRLTFVEGTALEPPRSACPPQRAGIVEHLDECSVRHRQRKRVLCLFGSPSSPKASLAAVEGVIQRGILASSIQHRLGVDPGHHGIALNVKRHRASICIPEYFMPPSLLWRSSSPRPSESTCWHPTVSSLRSDRQLFTSVSSAGRREAPLAIKQVGHSPCYARLASSAFAFDPCRPRRRRASVGALQALLVTRAHWPCRAGPAGSACRRHWPSSSICSPCRLSLSRAPIGHVELALQASPCRHRGSMLELGSCSARLSSRSRHWPACRAGVSQQHLLIGIGHRSLVRRSAWQPRPPCRRPRVVARSAWQPRPHRCGREFAGQPGNLGLVSSAASSPVSLATSASSVGREIGGRSTGRCCRSPC